MAKEKNETPTLAERALGLIPKPVHVDVEVVKEFSGIKKGHKKKLEISLAKSMEKKGFVKIIEPKKDNKNENEKS